MGFEQDAYEVNETANSVAVCVNLTVLKERNVMVTLFTVGITAQGWVQMKFLSLNFRFTFCFHFFYSRN